MNSTMTTIVPDYYNTTVDDNPCLCGQLGQIISCDLPEFIIYGVLCDLICLFGILGNTISIIVLSRPQMKSSINCLLVGLAVSDTMLNIIAILIFGLPRIYKYMDLLFYYNFVVFPKIFIFLYPPICMAQVTTVYMTLAVAIERYIAVCHPLKVRSFCTYKRAWVTMLVIAVLTFFYNSSKFWEYKVHDMIHWKYNVTVYCISTNLLQNKYYSTLYNHWLHFFVYVPFVYTFPFIILVILNIAIYRQVRKVNKDVQKLSCQQRNEINLTTMLLCVVLIFLICNILPLASKIYEIFIDEHSPWWMVKIGHLMVAINSSINFIIYMIFGNKFRKKFFKLFRLSRQHEFKRHSMESQISNLSISIRLSQS